jgi:hypothetical protein
MLKLIERRGEVMITMIKNATFQYFGDNTKQRDWSVVRCYGGMIFFKNRGNIGKLHTDMYVATLNKIFFFKGAIIQGCIFVGSRGRKQTAKSLALAMATHQINGFQALTKILNGFGH